MLRTEAAANARRVYALLAAMPLHAVDEGPTPGDPSRDRGGPIGIGMANRGVQRHFRRLVCVHPAPASRSVLPRAVPRGYDVMREKRVRTNCYELR